MLITLAKGRWGCYDTVFYLLTALMKLKFALFFALFALTACQSTPKANTPPTNATAPHRTPSGNVISNDRFSHRQPTAQVQTQAPQTQPQAIAIAIPDTLKKVWRLTHITGTGNDDKFNSDLQKHAITIDLTKAPQGLAHTGCNQMNFAIKMSQDRFAFGNVSTTKKLCFDVMNLELTLAKSVRATRYYTLNDTTLLLYGQTVQLHLVPVQ